MKNKIQKEMDIRLELQMCRGSENFYRHPLFRGIHFTDGVMTMSEICSANWLLVDLLANVSLLKNSNEFIVVHIHKEQNSTTCSMHFEDGNKNEVRKPIPYDPTDFPLSDRKDPYSDNGPLLPAITFFYRNQVLYLPSEH